MATQTLLIKRRLGGGAIPVLPSVNPGELFFSVPGWTGNGPNSLWVDQGAALIPLVDHTRQVELAGPQTITGVKTFGGSGTAIFNGVVNMQFNDGVAGDILSKGPGTSVMWSPAPPATVITDGMTIAGDGTAGDPIALLTAIFGGIGLTWTSATHILSVTQATQTVFGGVHIATPALIKAGANDTTAVSPLGLRGELGADANTLTTAAKTIVPAINELRDDFLTVTGILVLCGEYDVATDNVTPSRNMVAGPLPVAAPVNEGWYLIVTTGGMGIGNAPPVQMTIGDWVVSDGTKWIHLDLHEPTTVAINVAVIPPVAGQDNVQDALEAIDATASSALQTIYVNPTTFSGDGLTAATELDVELIDCGTF
jgi:hypothetical protein